jgi:fatty acid synthase, animal type
LLKNFFLKQKEVDSVFEKLIDDINYGIVKPIDAIIFEAEKIQEAFKFISTGKHFGKILLKIRKDENASETLPMKVFPSVYCQPNESFIIVGGLGGLALEFADLLVLRGCKNLILNSPRGIKNGYQMYRIK